MIRNRQGAIVIMVLMTLTITAMMALILLQQCQQTIKFINAWQRQHMIQNYADNGTAWAASSMLHQAWLTTIICLSPATTYSWRYLDQHSHISHTLRSLSAAQHAPEEYPPSINMRLKQISMPCLIPEYAYLLLSTTIQHQASTTTAYSLLRITKLNYGFSLELLWQLIP